MSKLAACIIIFGLFLSAPTFASDDRFTVEIKVDVSDQNASIAREKALDSATRAAVTAVAKRISTAEGASKIANMTNAQLLNFIKETSVISERNSDVRYMADLRIIINEELLKQYMSERDIPLVTQTETSVVIIPIFREFSDDVPMLWETDNPWKQAWETSTINSAIKFITIQNSAGNMAAINAQDAAATNIASLEKIMSLSGANDVYVLDASYDGVEGINVIVTSLSGERFEVNIAGAKSSGNELFDKAVYETRNEIENRILTSNISQAAEETELTVLYPFASLGQWITAEQKIKSIKEITDFQVQAMTPGKAQFKISYTGSLENITRLIKLQGYSLKNGGDYMILSNIGE